MAPGVLAAAYERCRRIHAAYGRSYYLATLMLPRWKRPHVHALYGFTRYADEVVDDMSSGLADTERSGRLRALRQRLAEALAGDCQPGSIMPAVAHTVRRFAIPVAEFDTF